MRKILLFVAITVSLQTAAQTAKVYRGGSLIGTYTKLDDASVAANVVGDSIVLSAHTFYQHDIPIGGGQIWKGTLTPTDTTIVDAEGKGRGFMKSVFGSKRSIVFRDIIVQNGFSERASGISIDSLLLKGHSIIRYCHATNTGGAVDRAWLYDFAKLTHNTSDTFGGAGVYVLAFDSVEISYNSAQYGGAIGQFGRGGQLVSSSPGVMLHHNSATVEGGALYAIHVTSMPSSQIVFNSSPLGACMGKQGMLVNLSGCRIYNPKPDGSRQNELNIIVGLVDITGTWFGQSDTVGLIKRVNLPSAATYGKHAVCKWIVNRGKPVTKADTLFPVDAVFTYVDGTPLPTGSLPWLKGVFTTTKGSFVNPTPAIMPSDTLRGMYRAYTHLAGDTGSRSVSFVCSVDADTFRTTIPVWGKLDINENTLETEIKLYPNPATTHFFVSGLQRGWELRLEDLSGRQLLHKEVQSEMEQIDLQPYSTGSYLIRIYQGSNMILSQKILKQ